MEIITDTYLLERDRNLEVSALNALFADRLMKHTFVGKFLYEKNKSAFQVWELYVGSLAEKTIDRVIEEGTVNIDQVQYYPDLVIRSALMMIDGVLDPKSHYIDILYPKNYAASNFAIKMMEQAISEFISYDSNGMKLYYKVYEKAIENLTPEGILIFRFKFDYLIQHDFHDVLKSIYEEKGATETVAYVINFDQIVFQNSVLKPKNNAPYLVGTHNNQSRFYLAGVPLDSKHDYYHVSWMLEQLMTQKLPASPQLVRIIEEAYQGVVDMTYGDDLNEYESKTSSNFEDGEFIFSIYSDICMVHESYDLLAYTLNKLGSDALGEDLIDGANSKVLAIPGNNSIRRFTFKEDKDRIILGNFKNYSNIPEIVVIPKTYARGRSEYNYEDFVEKLRDLELSN